MNKMSFLLGICLLAAVGCSAGKQTVKETFVSASDERIQYVGRVNFSHPEAPLFTYPGVQVVAGFEGTSIKMMAKPQSGFYMAQID
ncbi:MAG: lipase, partial [Bacteroidaceae bacterium]|nr:lipase [Bacteroidaceae bacterium]